MPQSNSRGPSKISIGICARKNLQRKKDRSHWRCGRGCKTLFSAFFEPFFRKKCAVYEYFWLLNCEKSGKKQKKSNCLIWLWVSFWVLPSLSQISCILCDNTIPFCFCMGLSCSQVYKLYIYQRQVWAFALFRLRILLFLAPFLFLDLFSSEFLHGISKIASIYRMQIIVIVHPNFWCLGLIIQSF